MAYSQLSIKKSLTFSAFMLFLAIALGVTLIIRSGLPNEYLSFEGIRRGVALPLRTFKYSLDYGGGNKNSPSVLAAASNLLRPATVDVEVATSSPARDIPVLLYHGIVEEPDRFSLKEETFAEHMFALKRAGYDTVSLDEFRDFLRGDGRLNEKSFLLTFDDARLDAYYGVEPILRALGYNAVMFVAADDSLHVPRPLPSYYIHESLLAKMLKSGRWELGSHAVQDTGGFITIDEDGRQANFLSNKKWLPDLARLETDDEYRARVQWELGESKRVMESTFGVPIVSMSYPFGDYGQQERNNPNAMEVIEDVVRDIYEIGFRQVWRNDASFTSNFPSSDWHYLNRIEVGTSWSGEQLLGVIEDARAKDLPYSDDFSDDHGWKYSWGIAGVEDGVLKLAAATTTTGSLAFLDGARHWQNYRYTVSTADKTSESVTLIARFQDNDNYASCVFTPNRVRIEERMEGQDTRLVNISNPLGRNIYIGPLGLSVTGSTMRCFAGSREVASAELGDKLDSGGVGVSVWHPETGVAGLSVLSLEVMDMQQ